MYRMLLVGLLGLTVAQAQCMEIALHNTLSEAAEIIFEEVSSCHGQTVRVAPGEKRDIELAAMKQYTITVYRNRSGLLIPIALTASLNVVTVADDMVTVTIMPVVAVAHKEQHTVTALVQAVENENYPAKIQILCNKTGYARRLSDASSAASLIAQQQALAQRGNAQ
ncbi:hypothetical protein M1466_00840 [Candidatus Dependentiae bacterium]|nr:hypothetical protein [Candidatus Dependentiae bacterium]